MCLISNKTTDERSQGYRRQPPYYLKPRFERKGSADSAYVERLANFNYYVQQNLSLPLGNKIVKERVSVDSEPVTAGLHMRGTASGQSLWRPHGESTNSDFTLIFYLRFHNFYGGTSEMKTLKLLFNPFPTIFFWKDHNQLSHVWLTGQQTTCPTPLTDEEDWGEANFWMIFFILKIISLA